MKNIEIRNNWPTIEINSIEKFRNETEKRENWVFRGQNYHHDLFAQIDRGKLAGIDRFQKLWLENESINRFLIFVKNPGGLVEQAIINECKSNEISLITYRKELLMVMQHFSVPTRLVDWSYDPKVGLFFAVNNNLEIMTISMAKFGVLMPNNTIKLALINGMKKPRKKK